MLIKRLWLTKDPIQYQEWETLMKKAGLVLDHQVDWTVGVYANQQLIASGSLYRNIIKCVAVAPDYQRENVLSKLLAALKETLQEGQQSHLFLYTKPELEPIFRSLGFAEITQTQQVVFMEQGFPDIQDYQNYLTAAARPTQANAAIVMNANPFTNGHLYLVTTAAKQHATVYVFVVSADDSLFDAATRLRLVKAGVAHLENVVVLPTRDYLVSQATFPAYFLKDQAPAAIAKTQATLDATLFKEKIAAACKITTRYVGEEPLSEVTANYNQAMKEVFEPELTLLVIPRKKVQGEVISASRVRKLMEEKQYEAIQPLVPATTYRKLYNRQINSEVCKVEIIQSASAGTTESSDVLIMIDRNENEGIQIELDSNVAKQFGRQIRAKIEATLAKLAVKHAKVKVIDKGALDCTIQARTIAAVYRACGKTEIDWQVIRSWNV